jgi:hypothetical protein
MKKWLGFLLLLAVLASTTATAFANDKPDLPPELRSARMTLQATSNRFEFYTANSEAKFLPQIEEAMERHYRQLSRDFGTNPSGRIKVYIFPSHRQYAAAAKHDLPPDINDSFVFNSFVGKYNYGASGIYITPPNDSMEKHFDELYINSLLFGLTLAFADEITSYELMGNDALYWLRIGVPAYKSERLARESERRILRTAVQGDRLPTLAQLESGNMTTFSQLDGMTFAASIIEFIDKTYGFSHVVNLYKSPEMYNAIFNLSKAQFEQAWHDYLTENYKTAVRQFPPDSAIMRRMPLQATSDHFEFYTGTNGKRHLNRFEAILEAAYADLTERLGVQLDDHLPVFIYRSFDEYFEATDHYRPDDVTRNFAFGMFDKYGIHLTLPTPQMLSDKERAYEILVIHELAHALADELTPAYIFANANLYWMVEGFADFVAGDLTRTSSKNVLRNAVRRDRVPSIARLEGYSYERLIDEDGYIFSASIFEYIDDAFGFDKVLEFYQNPNDYEAVFGFGRDELERRWLAFIKRRYR